MKSHPFSPGTDRRAFTLIELLVVVVIIAILAALAIPAVNIVIAKMQATQTKAVMHDINTAVSRYRHEYNRFPADPALLAGAGEADTPEFQTDGSVDMINILTARLDPAKTPNLNAKDIPFLILPLAANGRYGLVDNSNGDIEGAPLELRDVWGQPYHVLLDTNYDSRIKNPDRDNGNEILRRGPAYLSGEMLIYSAGPDKTPNTKDDIVSWR